MRRYSDQPALRVVTCGSVDDGKSTLLGRLLFETGGLRDDQRDALKAASARYGTCGDQLDFALIFDGLAAEREQGITIDVSYRYANIGGRSTILIDAPGHAQYTRNMFTGASNADLAIVLVDATRGITEQTRRHAGLLALLGVPKLILAVSKMDVKAYSEATFQSIVNTFSEIAKRLHLNVIHAIPVSGTVGDNVSTRSANTPWFSGPSLLDALVGTRSDETALHPTTLRFRVQSSIRPNSNYRGYGGRIVGGAAAVSTEIVCLPSGQRSRIVAINVGDDECLPVAQTGRSVALRFADELDLSRGELVCSIDAPAQVADQIEVELVWMSSTTLVPGRAYWLQCGSARVSATVATPKFKLNVATLDPMPGASFGQNDIGRAVLTLSEPLAFDAYRDNKHTGSFILIDRLSRETVAAGMIRYALRRSQNIRWQALSVTRKDRATRLAQRPMVYWLTGLSGAGKSTIANAFEQKLHRAGFLTYLLDGDNLRHGLNRDLGFTEADRVENLRRAGEVARLMSDAGLVVIASFISPYAADRDAVRARFAVGEFVEVHVDAPLAVAESRDPKGLYKKARRGELKNFTGIDAPYETPIRPEFRIDTVNLSAAEAADALFADYQARLAAATITESDPPTL